MGLCLTKEEIKKKKEDFEKKKLERKNLIIDYWKNWNVYACQVGRTDCTFYFENNNPENKSLSFQIRKTTVKRPLKTCHELGKQYNHWIINVHKYVPLLCPTGGFIYKKGDDFIVNKNPPDSPLGGFP